VGEQHLPLRGAGEPDGMGKEYTGLVTKAEVDDTTVNMQIKPRQNKSAGKLASFSEAHPRFCGLAKLFPLADGLALPYGLGLASGLGGLAGRGGALAAGRGWLIGRGALAAGLDWLIGRGALAAGLDWLIGRGALAAGLDWLAGRGALAAGLGWLIGLGLLSGLGWTCGLAAALWGCWPPTPLVATAGERAGVAPDVCVGAGRRSSAVRGGAAPDLLAATGGCAPGPPLDLAPGEGLAALSASGL
jgi:hypothetical protein